MRRWITIEWTGYAVIAALSAGAIMYGSLRRRPSQEAVDWAVRDVHYSIYLARERGEWTTKTSLRSCDLATEALEQSGYVVMKNEYDCVVSWEHWMRTMEDGR